MFRKTALISLFVLLAFACAQSAQAFWFKKEPPKKSLETVSFVPKNDVSKNTVWVGTFQLVWNELIDNVAHRPVKFVKYDSLLADELNKKSFTKNDLSSDSYYTNYGVMTPVLKKEIDDNLEKKFNDKSDILDTLDWNSRNYLIYAILKKDFKYLKEMDELEPMDFEGVQVKSFGMRQDASFEKRQNADVLFYISENEYAVKLKTKSKDEVILYRTDDKSNLENLYLALVKKSANFKGDKKFTSSDALKVPFIKFDEKFYYNEFSGKKIKGTKFIIDEAIQTAKFNLDNKGGSLKSEAALIMRMSLAPVQEGRNFYFNKPFVLFLKEENKQLPYFITHFKNAELFEKP